MHFLPRIQVLLSVTFPCKFSLRCRTSDIDVEILRGSHPLVSLDVVVSFFAAANPTGRRLLADKASSLLDRALGLSPILVGKLRRQLPDDEFLKQIGDGIGADANGRIFKS